MTAEVASGERPDLPQNPTASTRRLVALGMPVFLASLGAGVANVGLPTLADAFDVPFQSVQWVVLAYLLATTTLIVSVGRLADIFGRRRLLLAGVALFTVASAVCGVAPSLSVLVAARAVQGLGAALMMALATALVSEAVAGGPAGRAMGLLGTMSAVGTAVGPALGGLLLEASGWRGLFAGIVPLGVVALILVRRHAGPDSRMGAVRARFDVAGTLLLATALGAYALAMTVGHGRFWNSGAPLLGIAGLAAMMFVRTQQRSPSPLVRLAVLRDGELRTQLLTSVASSAVVMTTLVVGPFYLTQSLGLAPASVGALLTIGPVVSAVSGVPSGLAADRFGTRTATAAGLGVMLAGMGLLVTLRTSLGIAGYAVPIAVVTAGYALVQAANNSAVMTGVSADERGVIAGLLGLSRNLGLVTGASAMGAVFAATIEVSDVATAAPDLVAAGMRATFSVAAVLLALPLVMGLRTRARAVVATSLLTILCAVDGQAQAVGTTRRPEAAPAPDGPYPVSAAGWGPRAGGRLFVSRWAEDWTPLRAAGDAPPLKAMPLGRYGSLTLSAEGRFRYDIHADPQLGTDDDYSQTLFRGVAGADVRLGRFFRVYSEVGTGQVMGRRAVAGANFQNDASLQQLFGDMRGRIGGVLVGIMVGRQEFADGPRQLVSVSEGPNLHRTWNGARAYAHARRFRVGAYDLSVTRQARGDFDETVNREERVRGVNASVLVVRGQAGSNVYVDPFWIRSEHPALHSGGRTGPDDRDTYGARVWGRRGSMTFDWTVVHQTGRHAGRDVDAWGLFAAQGVSLSTVRWQPRIELRLDAASGGVRDGPGAVGSFHQLYASSAYLGEGQLLGLGNLLMATPGLTVAPTAATSLSIQYGLARRANPTEAVRAGGMRTYGPTLGVDGRDIGRLIRVAGSRAINGSTTLFFTHEHLAAGHVLRAAHLDAGAYSHAGLTVRY